MPSQGLVSIVLSVLILTSVVFTGVTFSSTPATAGETTINDTGDSEYVFAQYNGTDKEMLLDTNGNVIWSNDITDGTVQDVAEVNNTLFLAVESNNGSVFAVNPSDGTVKYVIGDEAGETGQGAAYELEYSEQTNSVYALTKSYDIDKEVVKILEISINESGSNEVSWLWTSNKAWGGSENAHSVRDSAFSVNTSSGADILVGQNNLYAGINTDGSVAFNNTLGLDGGERTGSMEGYAADENSLVVTDYDNSSVKVYNENGGLENEFSHSYDSGDQPFVGFSTEKNQIVLSDPTDGTIHAYSTSGTEQWNTSATGQDVYYDGVDNELRSPSEDGSSAAVYAEYNHQDGTISSTFTASDSTLTNGFLFSESVQVSLDGTTSSGNLNGTVETELLGEAVPNATVEVLAVNASNVSKTPGEVVDSVSGIDEDQFDALNATTLSSDSLRDKMENTDGEYVYITDSSEWTEKGGINPLADGADIGAPKVTLQESKTYYVFSADATDENLALPEDWLNEQIPGQTTDSDVVFTRYSATGEELSSQTVVTNPGVKSGPLESRFGSDYADHEFGTVALMPGVYQVHPKGSQNNAQWVVVGYDSVEEYIAQQRTSAVSAPDVTTYPSEGWTGVNGTLLNSSDNLEQALNDGTIEKVVTTTNEDGEWDVSVPDGYETVAVMAYRADGEMMTKIDPANRSLQGMLQRANEVDYNSTAYMPSRLYERDLPTNEPLTVKVLEIPALPDTGSEDSISEYMSMLENAREAILNGNWSELEGIGNQYAQTLYDYYSDGSQDSQEQLNRTEEKAQQFCQDFQLDQTTTVADCSQMTPDTVQDVFDGVNERSPDMGSGTGETIIREVEPDMPEYPEPDDLEYPDWWEDGKIPDGEDPGNETLYLINRSVEFSTGWLDNLKSTMVVAQFGDGTTRVVSDEYYRVEEGGSTSTVHIENYPVPESKQVATFSVTASGTEEVVVEGVNNTTEEVAKKGQEQFTISLNESVPEIDSVNVNTIRPNSGDKVYVDVYSQSDVVSIEGVSAYSMAAQKSNGTVENGTARVTVTGDEASLIRLDVAKQGYSPVTETISVNAVSERHHMDAAVVLTESTLGTYGIAADNTERAVIEDNGKIGVRLSASDSTDTVRVFDRRGSVSTDSQIQLLDSQGQQIEQRKTVYYHTKQSSIDGLVRVNGKPVTQDSAAFGQFHEVDGGTVIETYSNPQGQVDVTVNNNPSFVEQGMFWLEATWHEYLGPSTGFPIATVSLVDLPDNPTLTGGWQIELPVEITVSL